MLRHHMTQDGPVDFTPEEEAEADARAAAKEVGAVVRNALAEIKRLEGLVDAQLVRDAILDKPHGQTGKLGKIRMQEIEDLLDIERAKL